MIENIILGLISAVVGSIFGPILVSRFSKTPQERTDDSRNLNAKTESEIVKAANDLVAGSTAASKAVAETLLRSNEYLKQEVAEVRIENTKLESEIATIKESRRQNEIKAQADQETSDARLKAELIDSRNIRVENGELKKQVNKLESMFINMAKYIDTMNTALKAANIPVPQNGELMDSVRRLQLSIEERAKLKVGK